MIETTTKICDECQKEIQNKKGGIGFSEWTVYHFKKRRDFCSMSCFTKFFLKYLSQKIVSIITSEEVKKIKRAVKEIKNGN